MHAVIESNGHQFLVRAGDRIELEGLGKTVGEEIRFDRVLAVNETLGAPMVSGASVTGKVVYVGRGKKIFFVNYRRRKRYRRRIGFRASLYQVEITGISGE